MVDYVRWVKRYPTGIETIDNQHRELAEKMNTFEQLLEHDYKFEELDLIFLDLIKLMKQHFADEENLLNGHSDFEYHKHEHEKHVQAALTFHRQLQSDENSASISQMFSYFYMAFLQHTLTMDKEHLAGSISSTQG